MNKTIFSILSIVLALSLLASATPMAAFAADEESDNTVTITNSGGNNGGNEGDRYYHYASGTLYGNVWKTVVNENSGLNEWIRITVTTTVDSDVDIIMYDANWNVVWYEYKAFRADDDGYREFWCGSNVCKIDIRLSSQNPFVIISMVTAPYLVEFDIPHS